MSNESELKPCPHCGGPASLALCGFGTAKGVCTDCGSEGAYSASRSEAIAAWNRRTPAQAGAGAVAWRDPACPRHVIADADKRDLMEHNGPVGRMRAEPYTEPLYLGPPAALLERVRSLIADDAYACTFQTFGQYRTALLKELDAHMKQEDRNG